MANTVIELKHSQVAGNTPASLANGEISINTYDGKIFYKDPSGVIRTYTRYPGPSGLDTGIQFNDGGSLGANASLTFNKATGNLRTKIIFAENFVEFPDGTKQFTANAGPTGAVVTISNDVSTNSDSYFPTMATANSGTLSTAYVSSTKLYYNPSTGTLHSTNYNSLSDETLKENIEKIISPMSILERIDGVTFKWKDNKQKGIGVIAQEVERVIPEIVETSKEGIKSVSYTQLIPLLIEAIKEQQKEINKLKKGRK